MRITEPAGGPTVDEQVAVGIVESLAAAKSRQLVDEALAIYDPEAVVLCPPLGSRSEGHDELRRSLHAFFSLVPDYAVTLDGYGSHGARLAAWGTIRMTLARTFSGLQPNGQPVTTSAFLLFEFREGRVVWENLLFDLADVARQSGVPAEALQGAR